MVTDMKLFLDEKEEEKRERDGGGEGGCNSQSGAEFSVPDGAVAKMKPAKDREDGGLKSALESVEGWCSLRHTTMP